MEVYAFERSAGRELRESADLFVPIGENMIFRESHQDVAPPTDVDDTPVDEPVEEVQVDEEAEAEVEEPLPPSPPRTSGFGAGILTDPDDDG